MRKVIKKTVLIAERIRPVSYTHLDVYKRQDYGYHIVYFVGESDTRYCDTLAENSKRSEDYENWLNACMGDGYEVSTNLIFKLTEKKA